VALLLTVSAMEALNGLNAEVDAARLMAARSLPVTLAFTMISADTFLSRQNEKYTQEIVIVSGDWRRLWLVD